MENFEDFNIDDIFADVTSSTSLGEGIHENVRLVSVDIEKRKDRNNKPLKMQLWLKFKKYDKDNNDVGEKEISFFMLDPTKESVINNLITYMQQLQSVMSIYVNEEVIDAKFDPINAIVGAKSNDDITDDDLNSEVIRKTVLTKSSHFKVVEQAIKEQFLDVVKDHIGPSSEMFRLKLEESRDGKYIQIPMFAEFIEKTSVDKSASLLYN